MMTDSVVMFNSSKRRSSKLLYQKFGWLQGVGLNLGFTLVELIVVIAVISILAATAIPRFASGDVFETRGDAGTVSASLRYAQKTAIAQRKNVYVVFGSTTPPSVSVCFTQDCSQTVLNPENDSPYSLVLANNTRLISGTIGFDSLGRPVPNQNASVVVFSAKGGAPIVMNVEQDTGYIR